MNKALILKAFGGSEEDFYNLYPTEAHFKLAFGGTPLPMAQVGTGKTKNPFVAPVGARKVAAPEAGYKLIEGQDPTALKTYYDMQAEEAPKGKDPGKSGPPSVEDKKKYEEVLMSKAKAGYHPDDLEKKGWFSDPELKKKLMSVYQAQYVEKAPPPPPPKKQMDLGIGWAGERKEEFGFTGTPVKDAAGNTYNSHTFTIPGKWDPKTKGWDTSGSWNQGTTLTGYYDDKAGKFVHYNPSSSKYNDKGYYEAENLVSPEYVQQAGTAEGDKIMKHGPLIINGATAVDVTNSGMGYNPEKDVVEPLNTRGGGRGIGKSKLIKDVGVENLPAGTGYLNTGQPLIQNKEGGPLYNPSVPDFFNPQYLMSHGGAPYFSGGDLHDFMKGGMPCYMDDGGVMSQNLQGAYPSFNNGGMEGQFAYGGDPSISNISSRESLNMFRNIIKKASGGPAYPGQTQDSVIEENKNKFLHYLRNTTMDAVAREQNDQMMKDQMTARMQGGGSNDIYGFNSNLNNQNAFTSTVKQGKEKQQQSYGNFFSAAQNVVDTSTPYTQTTVTPMAADGIQVMTNPATGKPYSPEEYAYLKSHFETPAEKESSAENKGVQGESKVQPWYQSHGKNYFPMNYDPVMEMSDESMANWQKIANDPTTNLKEFHAKKRLFGKGVRRVDMVFGTKSQYPEFHGNEPKYDFQKQSAADIAAENNRRGVPTATVNPQEKQFVPPTRTSPGGFSAQEYMQGILRGDKNVKAYGGMPTYQSDIFGSQTGDDENEANIVANNQWGFQGASKTPDYRTMAFGKQPAPVMMQNTGAPPVSGNTIPLTKEDQYKVTQKFKNKIDTEAGINWGFALGEMGIAGLDSRANAGNLAKAKALEGADAKFGFVPAGARGHWGNNMIDPANNVAVQFKGQNFGQHGSPYASAKYGGFQGFEEGGEYYMTDDEINAIMKAGGQIDFLD